MSFHEVHRACHTRLEHRRWCPTCDCRIEYSDVVKGYESEPGEYAVIEPQELRDIRPEPTQMIHLVEVARRPSVDPMCVERPYYLAPDGRAALEAFAVLREGLRGRVAVGTTVMFGREHLVALEARHRAIAMFMLRRHDELRPESDVLELDALPADVPEREVVLARQVLDYFPGELDLSQYRDTYEQKLRELIDRRVPSAAEAPRRAADTPNLLDALRASLADVSGTRRRPVKAPLRKAPSTSARAPRKPLRKVG
jgi:DNA end-binding protein Ku